MGKTASVIKTNWFKEEDPIEAPFLGIAIYCGESKCKENYCRRMSSYGLAK